MSRNERFNFPSEIKRAFPRVCDGMKGAGPTIYCENGVDYYENSESHVALIGRTGTGKSNTKAGSIGMINNIISANENLIMIDPKAEGYGKYANTLLDKGYRVECIDFSNPAESPTAWDPLEYIKRLYRSSSQRDKDFAATMLSELARCIYPRNKNSDPFWSDSAAEFFIGCVYSLLEFADEDEINFFSIERMMRCADEKIGVNSYIKEFYNLLDDESTSKRYLSTYVNAPNETRMSIFSVAKNSITQFSQSKGLMNMLNHGDLNIRDIDVNNQPFAIFIIKPDENSTFDALCGFFITQITQHFIRIAREYNGKLPTKIHIILEELGSLGSSISNLPNLMVAARSRNIKIYCILQSYSQLEDIYDKSKAETIYSSIGVTIGFSTNNWDTLTEWSNRCGNKTVYEGNSKSSEPIITPNQIAAMPIATALVMIQGKYKFVCKFPFVDKKFQNVRLSAPNRKTSIKTFDIKDIVNKYKKKKREEMFTTPKHPFESHSNESNDEDDSVTFDELLKHFHNENGGATEESYKNDLDDDEIFESLLDKMVKNIDSRIKELEEKEEKNGKEENE